MTYHEVVEDNIVCLNYYWWPCMWTMEAAILDAMAVFPVRTKNGNYRFHRVHLLDANHIMAEYKCSRELYSFSVPGL